MDLNRLQGTLADLHLGGIRFFECVDSTNVEAMRWVDEGAPDAALVAANEQTAGRGRQGRNWRTVSGASLALSAIFYPEDLEIAILPRWSALGALAVRDALCKNYQIPAQIKWPNDVLLDRQKAAGVLAEAHWSGDSLKAVIVGIGINVSAPSIRPPGGEEPALSFPATCVEDFLEQPVEPLELLHGVMEELLRWRKRVGTPEFMQAWEKNLAFQGERVQIFRDVGAAQGSPPVPVEAGVIAGLAADGSLKLRDHSGKVVLIQFGEVRLRPAPEPF